MMLMLAGSAAAQSDARFSVGPGVTFFESTGEAGLMATASYLVTRPQLTINSAGQETRSRFHADSLVVLVAVVVGLF